MSCAAIAVLAPAALPASTARRRESGRQRTLAGLDALVIDCRHRRRYYTFQQRCANCLAVARRSDAGPHLDVPIRSARGVEGRAAQRVREFVGAHDLAIHTADDGELALLYQRELGLDRGE